MAADGQGKVTAFVTHHDCSRHDTGWSHPDHQGRLPALTRAVYRDMIALNEPLLDLEGRHATEPELLLVHTQAYLDRVADRVRQAAIRESPVEADDGPPISAASWDAATAAAGCGLVAADAVLTGSVRNAFAAVRPPGFDAWAEGSDGIGIFNNVAVLARSLVGSGLAPILVVELTADGSTRTREMLSADEQVDVISVYRGPAPVGDPTTAIWLNHDETSDRLSAAVAEVLAGQEGRHAPAFIIVALDLGGVESGAGSSDPLDPVDIHRATRYLVDYADQQCSGRLVSVLEGGYDAKSLGDGTVQHLRGLIGIEPLAAG